MSTATPTTATRPSGFPALYKRIHTCKEEVRATAIAWREASEGKSPELISKLDILVGCHTMLEMDALQRAPSNQHRYARYATQVEAFLAGTARIFAECYELDSNEEARNARAACHDAVNEANSVAALWLASGEDARQCQFVEAQVTYESIISAACNDCRQMVEGAVGSFHPETLFEACTAMIEETRRACQHIVEETHAACQDMVGESRGTHLRMLDSVRDTCAQIVGESRTLLQEAVSTRRFVLTAEVDENEEEDDDGRVAIAGATAPQAAHSTTATAPPRPEHGGPSPRAGLPPYQRGSTATTLQPELTTTELSESPDLSLPDLLTQQQRDVIAGFGVALKKELGDIVRRAVDNGPAANAAAAGYTRFSQQRFCAYLDKMYPQATYGATTRQILNNSTVMLTDDQRAGLLQAWARAIGWFTDDAETNGGQYAREDWRAIRQLEQTLRSWFNGSAGPVETTTITALRSAQRW